MYLLRGLMTTVQKMRHSRTGSMVMEDRRRCRSWTTSLDQKEGTTIATFAMKGRYGTRGIIIRSTREFKEGSDGKTSTGKRKKNWCGWKPETEERKIEFMKEIMENDGHGLDENLTTLQKTAWKWRIVRRLRGGHFLKEHHMM